MPTTDYSAAIRKGVAWLSRLQKEDGSYGPEVTELEAYYKSPLAFAEAGKECQGQATMRWITKNHLTPQGHFLESAAIRYPRPYCELYRDLWIIWGGFRLREFKTAERGTKFILQFFDRSTGGFLSSIGPNSPRASRELRSTALGGLVSLIAGHVEIALSAGDFVIETLALQPNFSKGFYLQRDSNGGLITGFPDNEERFFVVSAGQVDPLYYALGLAIAFLSKLFLQTQESKYLEAAKKYFEHCKGYGRVMFRHRYSGKLGWGLALLHTITGEPRYMKLAIQVADYLRSLQLPGGEYFARSLSRNTLDQPFALTIDRTAECTVWLTCIVRELDKRTSLSH